MDVVCGIEGQKPVECVHFAIYMWKAHSHMHDTHLHHVANQRNSRLWSLASKQRYWSRLVLHGCCVWNWGPKTYRKCALCRTCEKLILTCMAHTPTMSPVNESHDYDHLHQNKGTDQVWCFMDVVCGIEGQKPVKCGLWRTCEKLVLTCMKHTPTTSPVNETQDYD